LWMTSATSSLATNDHLSPERFERCHLKYPKGRQKTEVVDRFNSLSDPGIGSGAGCLESI
jgi:hypothetical protein